MKENKMLVQLHWQYSDKTELKAQRDIPDDNFNSEMDKFIEDTKASFPELPKGVNWMACNESSEYFVWAKQN